jgi:hypothetical protein
MDCGFTFVIPVNILIQLGCFLVKNLHAVLLVLQTLDHGCHLQAIALRLFDHLAPSLSTLHQQKEEKTLKQGNGDVTHSCVQNNAGRTIINVSSFSASWAARGPRCLSHSRASSCMRWVPAALTSCSFAIRDKRKEGRKNHASI